MHHPSLIISWCSQQGISACSGQSELLRCLLIFCEGGKHSPRVAPRNSAGVVAVTMHGTFGGRLHLRCRHSAGTYAVGAPHAGPPLPCAPIVLRLIRKDPACCSNVCNYRLPISRTDDSLSAFVLSCTHLWTYFPAMLLH
jgi:hypothetical protein